MKVDELKSFLRLCGLKVTEVKDELVARVFVAIENNLPILRTAEEVQADIATEYQAKLIVDDILLPDPSPVVEGWLNETYGVKFWPVTLYPEIFCFLAFHPNELANSDLSDYKTSKGYSYYCQGWLSPLNFHNIDGTANIAFLKEHADHLKE